MITINKLNRFLELLEDHSPKDWSWEANRRNRFWYVQYHTSRPPFRVRMEFNEEMLYIQYILTDFRVRSSCTLALYRVLLRLNEEISLLKFGLTAHGYVSLMGELPAAQFTFNTFQNLMYLVVHYLENLYWEIGIVAESPDLAPFLTSNEDALTAFDREFNSLVQTVKRESLAST